jgi:hypothetical protein
MLVGGGGQALGREVNRSPSAASARVRSHADRAGPSWFVQAAVPTPLPQTRRNVSNRADTRAGARSRRPTSDSDALDLPTSSRGRHLHGRAGPRGLPLRIRAIALMVANLDERRRCHSSSRCSHTAGWHAGARLRTPPCRQGRGYRVRFSVRSDGAPNRPARTAAAPRTGRKHARAVPARGYYLKRSVAGSYRSPVTFISRDRSKD